MAQKQQAEETKDARVAGAAAHWGYRFTANGTDYGDVTATLARITEWTDWCREWGVTATHYEQLAVAAEDAGELETAAGAWQRAALAWHWGKFVFVDDPKQQRAAHDRAVACFRKAVPALSPPAILVEIPYGTTVLPAYLRPRRHCKRPLRWSWSRVSTPPKRNCRRPPSTSLPGAWPPSPSTAPARARPSTS
jgi:hypothetical protein